MSLQQELGQALVRVPVEARELGLALERVRAVARVRVLVRARLGWGVLFL